MSEEEMESSSAEFEQHFFAGAEKVSLEIEVLKETYDDILAEIKRNGWEPDEGPRILLTLGLGYARGQYAIKADDSARAYLADRVTNLESLAAVMKFRTFSFMRDNQTLEMQMGGLRNSVTGLEGALHRLRPERDAFKAEVDRLTVELETLRQRLAVLEGEQPAPEPSWLDRFVTYFKRQRRE